MGNGRTTCGRHGNKWLRKSHHLFVSFNTTTLALKRGIPSRHSPGIDNHTSSRIQSWNFLIIHSKVVTVRKRSCGKVMFLHLSVSHSVHGGVYLSACWDTHTPPGRHPRGRPPWADTPLPSACWDTHQVQIQDLVKGGPSF